MPGSSDAEVISSLNRWRPGRAPNTLADPLGVLVTAFCVGPVAILLGVSIATGSVTESLVPQCLLTVCSICALRLLREYPLVNPVHAVILLFHWWFGYGQAVCAAFFLWKDDLTQADLYLNGAYIPMILVALGLPLYAISARWVLRHWHRPQLGIILPSDDNYSMRDFAYLSSVAIAAALVLYILSFFGLRAYETTNYLGAQVTSNSWLVPLAETTKILGFVVAAAASSLAAPHRKTSLGNRFLLFAILIVFTIQGIGTGSKGMLVLPLFYFVIAYANLRRRLPWTLLIVGLIGYLTVVEPFVASTRIEAERSGAVTSDERRWIFADSFKNFKVGGTSDHELNVESLFRGIYSNAIEISAISTTLDGPWGGQTLKDGLSALMPRFLVADKADSNMGNFFARQLGGEGKLNYVNNIAISIPFEIAGNYGLLAAWSSFAILGMLWAGIVAFCLTPCRMTTHPLTPFFIAFVMAMESSVGQFGNQVKMLAVDLLIFASVCWLLHKTDAIARRKAVKGREPRLMLVPES